MKELFLGLTEMIQLNLELKYFYIHLRRTSSRSFNFLLKLSFVVSILSISIFRHDSNQYFELCCLGSENNDF